MAESGKWDEMARAINEGAGVMHGMSSHLAPFIAAMIGQPKNYDLSFYEMTLVADPENEGVYTFSIKVKDERSARKDGKEGRDDDEMVAD